MNELLALIEVHLGVIACETGACAADGEALLVEQTSNLSDDEHILTLIVAAVAATLDGLELRELLFPVAQHVRLYPAQIAHLTDGEVALARDRGQFAVIAWFQHTLRRVPSI